MEKGMGYRSWYFQMKKAIYTFICTLAMLLLASAEVPDVRKEELRQLFKSRNLTDGNRTEQHFYADWILRLSAEERAFLIPIVQQQRTEALAFGERDQQHWNGLLAFLGDEEAMVANIEFWRGTGGDFEVSRAESGQLPLYLEPELFLQEDAVEMASDTGVHFGKSFGIVKTLLDYVHYNKHYPQDVREWAGRTWKRHEGFMDPTPLRKVTREWYRANEAFIRAKQYDKVKLGEELPPLPRVLEEAGLTVPPPAIPNEMQGGNPAPKPKPAVALPPAEAESHSSVNYLIFAAASVLLAALTFFCRSRFKKQGEQDTD